MERFHRKLKVSETFVVPRPSNSYGRSNYSNHRLVNYEHKLMEFGTLRCKNYWHPTLLRRPLETSEKVEYFVIDLGHMNWEKRCSILIKSSLKLVKILSCIQIQ